MCGEKGRYTFSEIFQYFGSHQVAQSGYHDNNEK